MNLLQVEDCLLWCQAIFGQRDNNDLKTAKEIERALWGSQLFSFAMHLFAKEREEECKTTPIRERERKGETIVNCAVETANIP